MPVNQTPGKFALGRIVSTPNALKRLTHDDILRAINRHHAGDWGDVDGHDHAANERALKDDSRIFSVYHSHNGMTFWIITDSDRSSTCVLLPEDY